MQGLFDFRDDPCCAPLTEQQRINAAKDVIKQAKYGVKYAYTMSEVAGILHWSYDQIFDAIHFFKLDAYQILSLVRVPWWSFAEYLIDPAEDVDDLFQKYLDKIPRKKL